MIVARQSSGSIFYGGLSKAKVPQNEVEEIQTVSVGKDARTNGNKILNDEKYIIDEVVDQSHGDGRSMFRLRWYRFSSSDDAWKSIDGLLCSRIMRYVKRVRKFEWPLQTILSKAVVG